MRNLFLLLCFLICTAIASAQPPTMEQKLYYSCKVWGFVKYYHSEVSTCKVDWDSVLMHTLPLIKSATTNAAFNDALDTMLLAAGPMALSTTYFPDTIKPELKRNRDWGWIGAPVFRADVRMMLDTIKNNFRPHANCWVEDNKHTSSYGGWLVFPYDSLGLNINTAVTYPSENQRMLMLYKYWNIITYFNPYNYVTDVPWDTVLVKYVVPVKNAIDAQTLYHIYLKIGKYIDDGHVATNTFSNNYFKPPGFYCPYLRLRYSEGSYVVVKSAEPAIHEGDAIVSIDGMTTKQWEDSLRPYYSSGNESFFRRMMYQNMLNRTAYGVSEEIIFLDSTGTTRKVNIKCAGPLSNLPFFNSYYYPNDSLNSIIWTKMPCDIGYVNMGILKNSDVSLMYDDLQNTKAIIFDLRNYPNGTMGEIIKAMHPGLVHYSTFNIPDVTYPGTFSLIKSFGAANPGASPYLGKVIVLINEISLSQAEFACMLFEAIPGVIKVGSQTAGADGNVTSWKLAQDITTGFSSIGIFYPNGDSTQRIGIVPDSMVRPTRWGIRRHRDEVLEKALTIAGCNLFSGTGEENIKVTQTTFSIIPNPANDVISIHATNTSTEQITVTITDISGRALIQKVYNGAANFSATIDIKALAAGMYFVNIKADGKQYVTKLVKR